VNAHCRLRASIQLGELVRELDSAQGTRDPETGRLGPAVPTKDDAIERAGLSRPTAHRYQTLTGGRDEIAQGAWTLAMRGWLKLMTPAAG